MTFKISYRDLEEVKKDFIVGLKKVNLVSNIGNHFIQGILKILNLFDPY